MTRAPEEDTEEDECSSHGVEVPLDTHVLLLVIPGEGVGICRGWLPSNETDWADKMECTNKYKFWKWLLVLLLV